ncbi:MAG: hypothetical protein R3F48_00120 [Candidatus Zixiibacteriota bacterium]
MKKEEETDTEIEEFIRLPKKNLASRIEWFEKQIRTREKLSDESIAKLNTQQFLLEERIKALRYAQGSERATGIRKDFQIQHQILEVYKLNEILACFKDVSYLQFRIQDAQEELNKQNQRLKLLD